MSDSSEGVSRARLTGSRDLAELRQLKDMQSELAEAVDLQIEVLQMERRVRGRLPHPTLEMTTNDLQERIASGHPALRFSDIVLDWAEFRLIVRQATDLLHRFDTIEKMDAEVIQTLAREGRGLEPLAAQWYDAPRADSQPAAEPSETWTALDTASLDQVLLLAMRPFLVRSAEAAFVRLDLARWMRGYCPVCGSEPELAVITRDARRLLVCGRCVSQWAFDPMACPHCGNGDKTRITSFASRDRIYRIAACDVCQRYLKAYDARQTDRPFQFQVDAIATLPLDAAAMQRGYH